MNIYKVEQDWNDGYDTCSDFICVASSEQEAREMHPSEFVTHNKDGKWYGTYSDGDEYVQDSNSWVSFSEIDRLKVTLLGIANEEHDKGIECASFHAG